MLYSIEEKIIQVLRTDMKKADGPIHLEKKRTGINSCPVRDIDR
jgi:hypothetical protein